MDDVTKRLPRAAAAPLRAILRCMEIFTAFGGLLMAVTFLAVVVIRYGFAGNLFAYEEWLLAISFWTFFLGAALAAERQTHVNADILGVVIKHPKLIWWRGLIVYVIELLIGLYIVYWCYLAVAVEVAAYPLWETTAALRIPSVLPRSAILVGFSLMVVFTAIYMVLHIIDGPQPQSDEETV